MQYILITKCYNTIHVILKIDGSSVEIYRLSIFFFWERWCRNGGKGEFGYVRHSDTEPPQMVNSQANPHQKDHSLPEPYPQDHRQCTILRNERHHTNGSKDRSVRTTHRRIDLHFEKARIHPNRIVSHRRTMDET